MTKLWESYLGLSIRARIIVLCICYGGCMIVATTIAGKQSSAATVGELRLHRPVSALRRHQHAGHRQLHGKQASHAPRHRARSAAPQGH